MGVLAYIGFAKPLRASQINKVQFGDGVISTGVGTGTGLREN